MRASRPFAGATAVLSRGRNVCHVAILHPPGGVVGGDDCVSTPRLTPAPACSFTTPAAGKFYRSAGPGARQIQQLRVATGAALEWLPQENILYNGARVHALTRVELQGDARFLGWEIFCLGRPAAGETFKAGEYRQDFELWRDGEPLYLEQGRYIGGDPIRRSLGFAGPTGERYLVCATRRRTW